MIFNKKTCLNVRGETTIHPTAMGGVLLKRTFNYLLWYVACADWLI